MGTSQETVSRKGLGKYPTLWELEIGRKITRQDIKRMDDELKKAIKEYDEYLIKKILGKTQETVEMKNNGK